MPAITGERFFRIFPVNFAENIMNNLSSTVMTDWHDISTCQISINGEFIYIKTLLQRDLTQMSKKHASHHCGGEISPPQW